MCDFSADKNSQDELDRMEGFVRDECEPLDLLFPHGGDPYDVHNKVSRAILKPLQARVKEQGLGAATSAASSAVRGTARWNRP